MSDAQATNQPKPKVSRAAVKANPKQLEKLLNVFESNPHPYSGSDALNLLIEETGLKQSWILSWFGRHRKKARLETVKLEQQEAQVQGPPAKPDGTKENMRPPNLTEGSKPKRGKKRKQNEMLEATTERNEALLRVKLEHNDKSLTSEAPSSSVHPTSSIGSPWLSTTLSQDPPGSINPPFQANAFSHRFLPSSQPPAHVSDPAAHVSDPAALNRPYENQTSSPLSHMKFRSDSKGNIVVSQKDMHTFIASLRLNVDPAIASGSPSSSDFPSNLRSAMSTSNDQDHVASSDPALAANRPHPELQALPTIQSNAERHYPDSRVQRGAKKSRLLPRPATTALRPLQPAVPSFSNLAYYPSDTYCPPPIQGSYYKPQQDGDPQPEDHISSSLTYPMTPSSQADRVHSGALRMVDAMNGSGYLAEPVSPEVFSSPAFYNRTGLLPPLPVIAVSSPCSLFDSPAPMRTADHCSPVWNNPTLTLDPQTAPLRHVLSPKDQNVNAVEDIDWEQLTAALLDENLPEEDPFKATMGLVLLRGLGLEWDP